MKKTKTVDMLDEPKNPALTPGEYWEWRTTISELNESKHKQKIANLELNFMIKEAELLSARIQIYKLTRMEAMKQEFENSQAEYGRFKKVLEEKHKTTLTNKIIDDLTFEIKDLPQTTNISQ